MTRSDPLARVKRAAAAKRRAENEYRAALQAARDAGHPASAIGKAAGTTRQNVLKLTQPRTACTHPPSRLHAWRATDGTQCVACNDCGASLAGGV